MKQQLRVIGHEKHACYVLITCGEPNKDGKMQVELTYKGDPTLAAFLLENAQGYMDDATESP